MSPLQAAGYSGGVDAAPEWLEKRFLSFNSFIVTALLIARIVRLESILPASQDCATIAVRS